MGKTRGYGGKDQINGFGDRASSIATIEQMNEDGDNSVIELDTGSLFLVASLIYLDSIGSAKTA